MIYRILFTLTFSSLFIANVNAIDPVSKIMKANEAKTLANEAYKKGNFKEALKQYSILLDTLNYPSEKAQLNKAHSLFQLKDTINAFDNYRALSTAEDKKIRSTSFMQMGNLAEQQKEYENALSYFKEAIKADPTNQDARYNYELLKKKMQQQEEQEQEQDSEDPQDQDKQEDSDEKESEDKNSEGDNSDESQEGEDSEKSKEEQESEDQKKKDEAEEQQKKDDKPAEDGDKQEQQQQKEGEEGKEEDQPPMKPSTKEKLEEMNISEDKAKMLLEALRNKEAQYFQQMRKRATERPKSGKPDW